MASGGSTRRRPHRTSPGRELRLDLRQRLADQHVGQGAFRRQLGDEPPRMRRMVILDDPGDQGMIPACVVVQCSSHGGVDRLSFCFEHSRNIVRARSVFKQQAIQIEQ